MRVLLSVRESNETSNPYVDLLEHSIPAETEILRFSYRRAIFGNYDVLHAQWPEYIFRGSTKPKALVKAALGVLLMARLKATRTPVIVTVHNIGTHERAGRLEQVLVRWVERIAISSIYLNEARENNMSSGVVILHGRYPNDAAFSKGKLRGSVGFFGQVRPYKGVEALIEAARLLPEESFEIAGMPIDEDYAKSLVALATDNTRLTVDLRHLSSDELEARIRASKLVVLPYRYMYNSGAAILALGLSTPVLVPRSGSTETLSAEVGESWVHLFDPPFDRGDLENATIAVGRIAGTERPDLSRRDWPTIGRLHQRLYEIAAANRTRSTHDARAAVRAAIEAEPDFVSHSRLNQKP